MKFLVGCLLSQQGIPKERLEKITERPTFNRNLLDLLVMMNQNIFPNDIIEYCIAPYLPLYDLLVFAPDLAEERIQQQLNVNYHKEIIDAACKLDNLDLLRRTGYVFHRKYTKILPCFWKHSWIPTLALKYRSWSIVNTYPSGYDGYTLFMGVWNQPISIDDRIQLVEDLLERGFSCAGLSKLEGRILDEYLRYKYQRLGIQGIIDAVKSKYIVKCAANKFYTDIIGYSLGYFVPNTKKDEETLGEYIKRIIACLVEIRNECYDMLDNLEHHFLTITLNASLREEYMLFLTSC